MKQTFTFDRGSTENRDLTHEFSAFWQALMFTVVVGGVLFTLGIIVQRPGITDAAFNPLICVASFLAGLVVLRRRPA